MEFTPRDRQILIALLTQKEALPVKNLAQKINVSKRTVQRELDYISYILKNYNINLCSKTGAGIWLEGEEAGKQMLLKQLENQDDRDFADKSERRKGLILEMLKDQTPKKLYYYANLFSVSEATISKDMEHVEPWFQKFELQIIRKQGYGVYLQGSEKNLRVAIREFIKRYIHTPVLNQLYEASDISTPKAVGIKNIKNQYQLLDEDILKQVGICFASIPDDRIRRLTEESYIGLILHVTIAIERVLGGEFIESNDELLKNLKQDDEYNLALLIVNSLEQEFGIEIPDIEIAFICLHIKASKLQRASEDYKNDKNLPIHHEEIRVLVQGMIVAYDEQLASVLAADEEFTTGLAAHLRPTLVRLKNHMPIENPHLNEIKESYTDVYEHCLKVGKFLEANLGCEIPETEIGFIAIHFGAALVRLESEKEKKRTVSIGLVCASGIGISRLMASRLQKYLKARANITTYGKTDLTPFVIERNDFFVSSMELGEIDTEVVQVSPLLPEDDLLRIDEKVQQYAGVSKKLEYNSDFVKQMEKINDLAGKIKEILRNFFCMEVESEVSFQQLLELAAKKITPFKENQTRFIESIMDREEIATQIIPELGIGLLHTRLKDTYQNGFYVCVPGNHINFQNAYMQSVEAVVIMLIPEDENKQENSRLMGYLSESLIEDEKFLVDIKSGDEIRIKDTLSRLLKQYFNKYLDVV
ncbi:MAG: transcriptional antiterminator, BglG [Herbinix sp.]|jgi:mannitol operon transcriptional antiterminator|nr:transcriptional antiterminator, BglG [Herbinix sp.]